jgi:hypothetical protein
VICEFSIVVNDVFCHSLRALSYAQEIKVSPRGNYGRQRLTPFARAQSYSNQYPEKGLLVEERTAHRIAASVLRHTAGSPDKTLFYDGEGGLCHVAAQVYTRSFEADIFATNNLLSAKCVFRDFRKLCLRTLVYLISAVLRIRDMLVRIRLPDPAIFVSDLQDDY